MYPVDIVGDAFVQKAHITPKEIKIETLPPTEIDGISKRLIFVDFSNVEETQHHAEWVEVFKEQWELFEPDVPYIVLPYICDKSSKTS